MGSVVGIGNPYRFSRHGLVDRLLQRMLEEVEVVTALLGPPPESKGCELRVVLRMLRTTKCGWDRTDLHVHAPPRGLDPDFWRDWVPAPGQMHPDETVWRRRARDTGASRWARAARVADEGPPSESFDTYVRAYGGLARLWSDRPDLLRIHGAKARLRRFTMRSAASEPPSFAPGFLRHLPALAATPAERNEVVPRFVWSDSDGWRLEPEAEAIL